MILHMLIAMVLGCLGGIVTGLTPGVHINLVSLILLDASAYLLGFTEPISLAAFIISMGITHTFLDAVPSIFLGAPDDAKALAVLPGHRMLLEGRGYEAVKLTVIGAFCCLVLTVILSPLLIPILPAVSEFLTPYIGWILLVAVVYMILREQKLHKILWNLFIFFASGALGILVFSFPNLDQPLLPLLSGLFGISGLLLSLSTNTKIPEQRITEEIKLPKLVQAKAFGAATFSGMLTGFFPGLGAAQAAVIATQIVGDIGAHAFMVLVGGIGTVNFLFSFVTFYAINKARNGVIIVVQELMNTITLPQFYMLIGIILMSGAISVVLALQCAKIFSSLIVKVNYKKLCYSVIAFVACLVFYFSGWIGLFILAVSTSLGMIAPLANVNRNHAMGCLLLPVIMFFLL
jgi:putative membrane protein